MNPYDYYCGTLAMIVLVPLAVFAILCYIFRERDDDTVRETE